MPDTYDEAAVQQILALARARQGQRGPVPRSQLIEISRELQISPANFLAAEEDWLVRQDEAVARSTFDQYRHQQLLKSVRRFGVGVSLLLLSDFLTTRHLSWSLYLTLGWVIIIALNAWQIYGASEESYNRAFRRWWLRQQIGESFKAISERLRSSPAEGDRVVASDFDTIGSSNTTVAPTSPDSAASRPLSGREP